ncbi:MAG TPA: hypothetical protein VMR76_02105 [Candidatus Saccharimonadia bacterium]|nr:hypothetical protein [Candidatus Saccharimonadia bacterium]
MFFRSNKSSKKGTKSLRHVKLEDGQERKQYMYHSQRLDKLRDTNRLNDNVDKGRFRLSERSWFRNLPTILAFLAVLATIVYISTLNDRPQIIVENTSQINFLHSNDDYQSSVQKILDGSLLNKSKFTINTNSIETKLEMEYPELQKATVIIPLTGHKLQLVLVASKPVATLENKTGYYLLSDQGVIIMKFSSYSQMLKVHLPLIIDQSNSKVSLGTGFISSESISFIENIIFQYSKHSVDIEHFNLPVVPYEVDVQTRGENYITKYNLLADSNYQIGTYFSTIEYIEKNNQPTPTQYIDLRVPGKAFIK